MATSENLKIAKIQSQMATKMVVRDIALGVLSNPLLTFIGGAWGALALQEKYGETSGFADFFEKGAALTAVGGIATAQALAPILPDLIKAGGEAGSTLLKAVPLLK